MTKHQRTILFFILVFIFLITTPLIIFYSEGYRFDFKNGKIIETGGFFIKAHPKEVHILIDDKKEKTTSGFSKSILIQNLSPKTYNIKIYKNGFLPWEKNIEIKEKKVSEIDLVLFKKKYEKNLIEKNILDIYKIDNGFFLKKENGFYYYNSENKQQELINKNIDWDNIQILKNDILAKKDQRYYLLSTKGVKEFKDIGQSNFNKDNLNNLYYKIENRLYKNNKLIKNDVPFYQIHNNTLYYFKKGFLFREEAKLTDEKIDFKINKNYELLFINNKIFLNENNEKLYLLDENQFKKILNLNNYLEYSEWNGKILFNTGNEIWIYFSKENHYPEFINKNTLKLLARFYSPLNNLTWINDKYYIFTKGKELTVSEYDYRDKINIFTIANVLDENKIFFDRNKIYIFENNNLSYIDKIIP